MSCSKEILNNQPFLDKSKAATLRFRLEYEYDNLGLAII